MPDPTPAAAVQPKLKKQWLVSNRDDNRVVHWDPSNDHPEGEAFLAGPVPAEVLLTPEISAKLREGELREATADEITKRQKQLGPVQAPAKGPWD